MLKSTRYSKVEYCIVCGCDPCDCHGVEDELRNMGTTRTNKARKKPLLARFEDRLPSISLMQVESRLIEPKNRILFFGMQRDLSSAKRAHRDNDNRGSE